MQTILKLTSIAFLQSSFLPLLRLRLHLRLRLRLLLRLFLLPILALPLLLLLLLPGPVHIFPTLPTSGAARCPRILRPDS